MTRGMRIANFVTAQPGQAVARPQHTAEARGDRGDHLIAGVMAEGVVDLAELVDIHQHHGRLNAVAVRRPDRALGAIAEQQPVGQARELVMHRLVRRSLRPPPHRRRLPSQCEAQPDESQHHQRENALRGLRRPERGRRRRVDDHVPLVGIPGDVRHALICGALPPNVEHAAVAAAELGH
jgi:hypothetical protein